MHRVTPLGLWCKHFGGQLLSVVEVVALLYMHIGSHCSLISVSDTSHVTYVTYPVVCTFATYISYLLLYVVRVT